MSDQEVIYSALRFLQSPSESQNRVNPVGTEGPGDTEHKEFSIPWRLIAIILGVLCLLQLMTVTVLGTKRKLYEEKWSCCGVSCYYFTTENKTWKGCTQFCQNYKSSILELEDEDEKVFIQSQIYKNIFWIGLSYNANEKEWKWVNSGKPSGYNFFSEGRCAFLTSTRITNMDCYMTYKCICEKKMDYLFLD
ncbi:killer cell lectin-like receptor 2 [Rhynchocyon petersi]